MNTYKISNITNLLGKREPKFNSIVGIEYIDNRTKKVLKLKAGETVFLTVQSLPMSVHKLRIKNMVTVTEVSLPEPVKPIKLVEEVKPMATKKNVEIIEKIVEEDEPKKKPNKYSKHIDKQEDN